MKIAPFQFAALVSFGLGFFDGGDETYDSLVSEVGTIVVNDSDTATRIMRRVFQNDAELSQLAEEVGVICRPFPSH